MATEEWAINATHDINYLKAHAEQTDITFGCYMRMLNKQADEIKQISFLLNNLEQKLNQIIIREGLF